MGLGLRTSDANSGGAGVRREELVRETGRRAEPMAVVEPFRPYGSETHTDPDRINVVRLVEFLGPVSPELVLVDPELAARARALLREVPGARLPRRREGDEPAPLRTDAAPGRRRIQWRLVTASAVATVAVAAGGFGWVATAGHDDGPVWQSSPPASVLTVPSTPPVEPGLSPEAIAALKEAKRREPRSPLTREALGTAYFRLGRWEEAEAEFRDLVELSPSDDFAHYALGRALVNQGRRQEATPHFKLARSLSSRGTPSADPLESG